MDESWFPKAETALQVLSNPLHLLIRSAWPQTSLEELLIRPNGSNSNDRGWKLRRVDRPTRKGIHNIALCRCPARLHQKIPRHPPSRTRGSGPARADTKRGAGPELIES